MKQLIKLTTVPYQIEILTSFTGEVHTDERGIHRKSFGIGESYWASRAMFNSKEYVIIFDSLSVGMFSGRGISSVLSTCTVISDIKMYTKVIGYNYYHVEIGG